MWPITFRVYKDLTATEWSGGCGAMTCHKSWQPTVAKVFFSIPLSAVVAIVVTRNQTLTYLFKVVLTTMSFYRDRIRKLLVVLLFGYKLNTELSLDNQVKISRLKITTLRAQKLLCSRWRIVFEPPDNMHFFNSLLLDMVINEVFLVDLNLL